MGWLAVVLGVEVDSLGNWRTPEALSAAAGGDETRARGLIRDELHRLGGMVASITLHDDVRDVGDVIPDLRGHVSNDAPGSSKTWAQSHLYALRKMGGRNVAMGTDINGLAGMPGPRFGTFAAYPLQHDERRNGLRRAWIETQDRGVAYDRPIGDFRWYRFEETGGGAYDMEERDIWEAVAMFKAGVNPWRRRLEVGTDTPPENLGPLILNRTGWQQNKINNIAKGLWVAHVDGFAHYGMMPDFLQDLRNVGLTHEDLAPLFRSAEDYIQLWERCQR